MKTRDIQRRMKGIKNIKQITKAMEMVASSKMRRATDRVVQTRRYADLAWEMLQNLSDRIDAKLHPLLQKRPAKKIGAILVTSDRGLCGAMNTQVIQHAIKAVEAFQKDAPERPQVEFITVGKKGRDFVKKYFTVKAEFTRLESVSSVAEISAIARVAIDDYVAGKYDKILLVFTDFVSVMKQTPRVKELLPILLHSAPSYETHEKPQSEHVHVEYKFEPSPDEVLKDLLPRLLEMQIFQALLESNASEHAARMVAMRNAHDATEDLLGDLQQTFNSVRQQSITQEIAEISTGAQFVNR